MDFDQALIAISALSQETRLRVFRILVEYGKSGAPAGVISERLGVSHNNLSFHLSHLSHAGLITSCKSGRSVIYCANTDAMQGLVGFLNENCCVQQTDECCQPWTKTVPSKPKKEKTK